MKLINVFNAMLFAFLLSACATGNGSEGWPVTTYENTCQYLYAMPDSPFCLAAADVSGGIKYRDEFEACRLSITNYIYALDA